MNKVGRFTWRPALLRSDVIITVEETGVSLESGAKRQHLEYDALKEVRYSEVRSHGFYAYNIYLIPEEGKELSFGVSGIMGEGSACEEFFRAASATLNGWASAKSMATVTLGMSKKANLLALAIVIVVMCFALWMMISELAPLDVTELFSLVMTLVVFLGIMAFSHRPRKMRVISAQELSTALAAKLT